MKIVAARNMPFVEEAFSTLGDVTLCDGRHISAADVRDADLLVTRSTTPITRELLAGSRVRFYGTATIGTDHMDIPWLEAQGIPWCSAAGCNADSVADYVVAAWLCLARRHGFTLAGKTLGIVGVGHVGTAVLARAEALGLNVVLNDPPRERRGDPAAHPWTPLQELLAQSDIVTLHVPLTREGTDATWHMVDEACMAMFKQGTILLNAARGPVVDTEALLRGLTQGIIGHAVIDCWEGEPGFSPDLLASAALGTPHIAGYSFEGKVMGTVMVYREACRVLGVPPTWTPEARLRSRNGPRIAVDARQRDPEDVLWEIVRQVYDIEADDAVLRAAAGLDADGRATAFDARRKQYPERREFAGTTLELTGADALLLDRVKQLGFRHQA